MAEVMFKLTGVDASVWEFNTPGCPLRLASTPTGIGGARFHNLRSQNVQQDGASWIDRNDEPLEIGLDVHLKKRNITGAQAIAIWNDWRTAIGLGDQEMLLEITSPGGGLRWCKPRLEDPIPDVDLDFLEAGCYFREKIRTMPDESWFRSEEVHETFAPEAFAAASITNAGDIASPPRYKVTGPITDASIGILGQHVTLNGTTIAAGEVWTIETDPDGRYVRDALGVNKQPLIYANANGARYWTKLAPPGATPVYLSGSGTTAATKIEVFLPQLFIRGAA